MLDSDSRLFQKGSGHEATCIHVTHVEHTNNDMLELQCDILPWELPACRIFRKGTRQL